ncbi:MAG: hypothetical protein ACRESZ_16805 [Methylococcales bacterium]
MKKVLIISFVIFTLLALLIFFLIPQDTKNRLARYNVEHFEGDYHIVTNIDGTVKEWDCHCKITSEPEKGYYYFKTQQGYVQVPIHNTMFWEK